MTNRKTMKLPNHTRAEDITPGAEPSQDELKYQSYLSKEWHKQDLQDFKKLVAKYCLKPNDEEYKDLKPWVDSGHSPLENACYMWNEDGSMPDYIQASRDAESLQTEYDRKHNN